MPKRTTSSIILAAGLVAMLFAGGCKTIYYGYDGKAYEVREDAESARQRVIARIESRFVTSKEQINYTLVFVVPTRAHVKSILTSIEGTAPPQADTVDYVVDTTRADIEYDGILLKRSGAFKEVKVAYARKGNGEGEGHSHGLSLEVRLGTKRLPGRVVWGYHMYGPKGKAPEFFSPLDVRSAAVEGWRVITETAKPLL